MARRISATRHAQAVFQIALEKKELEKWQADLETVADTLKDPQLIAMLENPKIHFSEKANLLQNILKGIGPVAMNLVSFLVAKNRLKILGDLVTEYKYLVDAHYGREHAEVITAIPLDEKDKNNLQQRLATLTNKEIVLTAQVDPNIGGGLIARIGDKLIDGSVRTKLQVLRRGLIEAGLEVR